MAIIQATSVFVFERIEPGQASVRWVGPMDMFKNAAITVTAHAFEGIGPSVSLTMNVTGFSVEMRPPSGERILWFNVGNTSSIPVRSFHVRISAITE